VCPQGSSETAAESLLTLDDASALTAAEQLVQHLAHLRSSSNSQPAAAAAAAAGGADAMDVDGNQQQQQQQQQQEGEGGAPAGSDPQPTNNAISSSSSSSSKEHQLLVGRRLLQALIGVWGDKQSKNNSGKRMCFYAQELNPKLGRARGLDLHSVAARLEAGLYDATQEPLEVRVLLWFVGWSTCLCVCLFVSVR
jgi:hypothetical protein